MLVSYYITTQVMVSCIMTLLGSPKCWYCTSLHSITTHNPEDRDLNLYHHKISTLIYLYILLVINELYSKPLPGSKCSRFKWFQAGAESVCYWEHVSHCWIYQAHNSKMQVSKLICQMTIPAVNMFKLIWICTSTSVICSWNCNIFLQSRCRYFRVEHMCILIFKVQ